MKDKLIFETIEGRVSSIEMFCRSKAKGINFEDLELNELIATGYQGIFWNEETQNKWKEEIINRYNKKTISHRYQVLSLLILMLWGNYGQDFVTIWKSCIFPNSRIETFTITDFFISSISLAYLDKKRYKVEKEVIVRFLQNKHNRLNPIKITENRPLKKSLEFSSEILNKKDVSIFDIGFIIAISEKLISDVVNRTLLVDIFCKLQNNLPNINDQHLNEREIISAVLFKRIKFNQIIARSKIFEGELYERTSIKDVHLLERTIPLILFLLIIVFELLRFYLIPSDNIIASILIGLTALLFLLLLNISYSGELKINTTIRKIIEVIEQLRKKDKKLD